jgi:hypothetical protein
LNTFNVKVYDFAGSTRDEAKTRVVSKQCKQPYLAASGSAENTDKSLYYVGDNKLVAFMRDNNTDYFRNENNEFILA